MQTPSLLFKLIPAKQGHIGLITLNRPQSLNALSGEMILNLKQQLQTWANDPHVCVVIITGSGRAFCAGGDLKMVYSFGRDNYQEGMHFYEAEYVLNLLIHDFPKPYIAILNGIAMGGGLGISLHGTRVIATEKLQLAMPEVAIGFYPDVGAAYFFKRCPEEIARYLGLTGNTIDINDALYANLVHAYIHSSALDNFLVDLSSFDLTKNTLQTVDSIIQHYQQTPTISSLQQHAPRIAECFNRSSIEEIISSLQSCDDPWAQAQADILNSRSPTSLKVTLRMLTLGRNMTLADCLAQELILTRNLMQEHDIYEGIRAVLVDKTRNPNWDPSTLKAVTTQQVDKLFK